MRDFVMNASAIVIVVVFLIALSGCAGPPGSAPAPGAPNLFNVLPAMFACATNVCN